MLDASPAAPTRRVPVAGLVVLLTMGTGSLDALVLVGVGHAFASVMTGNLVLVGLSIGEGSASALAMVLAALLGYASGGAGGSALLHRMRQGMGSELWPKEVTGVLGFQLALLSVLAIHWALRSGDFVATERLVVLALTAAAMGMQGAAMRGIGVAVSTTYMTGALTLLIESIVKRQAFTTTERSALVGLLALVAGAAIGGSLALNVRPVAMVFPCVTLGMVVASMTLLHYRRPVFTTDRRTIDA